jgi:hypothetical protein
VSHPLETIIDEARHGVARERAELAATIAADLARLDLFDRLLAPGAQPLGHSGQNQFPAFLNTGCGPSGGPRLRRLVSRLLTAGG